MTPADTALLINADLHCHSHVSDGTLGPQALAARAKANGVELWALTDHDETGGQRHARDAAAALGLPWVSGVEISVTFAGTTVHIVGLGFDVATDPQEKKDLGVEACKDLLPLAEGNGKGRPF